MNRDQKAARVEEVAAQIEGSEAIFAVDYRGISVPQAAELRQRLSDAGASFRIVKNTLTILAADRAGTEDLKGLLEGPTAFTFVSADGDAVLAAKALAAFRRETDLLEIKGGRMAGDVISVDEIQALSRLPALDVLHGQLVGTLASPVTGLVRGLNQLIAGIAQQLQQIADQGLVSGEAPAAEEEPAAEEPAAEEPAAEAEPPAEQDADARDIPPEEEPPADGGAAEQGTDEPEPEPETETETEAPSEEGQEQQEG
jgi:large subunit ribosomal protein L10